MLLNTALCSLQTSAFFFKQVKYGIIGAGFSLQQVIALEFHNGYRVFPPKVKCALYAVYSFTSTFSIQLQGRKNQPGLAQSVERLPAERKVAGSIPKAGPILGVLK